MGIATDLSDLKELSDGVVANKVSRFAYTQTAYDENDVDGVTEYNVEQAQNIPVGTPTVMKVNSTVVEKGYRARGSSITRMLLNHFLGRLSYNLNKVNDWFNTLLLKLSASLGAHNGIATLDNFGRLGVKQRGNLFFKRKTIVLWTDSSNTPPNVLADIAYGNGVYVALGYRIKSSDNGKPSSVGMYYSTDGMETWQPCNVNISASNIVTSYGVGQVFFENGKFIAVINDGWNNTLTGYFYNSQTDKSPICYSEDGVNWTMSSINYNVQAVYHGGGVCIATANNTSESPATNKSVITYDGFETVSTFIPSVTIRCFVETALYSNGTWVADTSVGIYVSHDDGHTWEQKHSPIIYHSNLATDGNGKWSCVMYYSSDDGDTWAEVSAPLIDSSAIYGNDKWLFINGRNYYAVTENPAEHVSVLETVHVLFGRYARWWGDRKLAYLDGAFYLLGALELYDSSYTFDDAELGLFRTYDGYTLEHVLPMPCSCIRLINNKLIVGVWNVDNIFIDRASFDIYIAELDSTEA